MNENGNSENKVEAQGVSLLRYQWAAVDAHAKDSGVISRSAALRLIIDDWLRDKAAEVGIEFADLKRELVR